MLHEKEVALGIVEMDNTFITTIPTPSATASSRDDQAFV
jgi:hypothetical protein